MLSLEANLRQLAGVETFWLDNDSNNLTGSIAAFNPDVVLIDVTSDCFPEVVEILETHPGAQVITLDKTQHTFTVFSGHSYPAKTLDDLVQAIGLSPRLPCESTSL